MTRKSLDGSISMVMSSGSQRISRYFPLLLAQELNYLPCKLLWLFSLSIYNICMAEIIPPAHCFVKNISNHLFCGTSAAQPLYSFLHLLEYSTLTTVVHYLLHWLSSMHSLQELLDTLLPLSIVSWRGQTGYVLPSPYVYVTKLK